MSDSILATIKKMLGIEETETAFDEEIIVNVNTILATLNQVGVGPVVCFSVSGNDETWAQFLGTATNLPAVKSYIYLKVRLLFDPPATSFVIEAIERQAAELEWRLKTSSEEGAAMP